jgi:SAM-dependent methyltransferase
VLRAIRTVRRGKRILEVGSGVEGLGTWYSGPFVGADLSFVGPRLPTLRAVIADGTRLPFPDRTFDLVACVDVLPELPRDLLAPFCQEMARVCAGSLVVVSVCGTGADDSIARELAWCRRRGVDPPEWLVDLVEHGAPSVEEIGSPLARFGRLTVTPNTSAAWNERLFRAEHAIRRARAMSAIQPPLRWAGRFAPFDLPGSGPVYRWSFRLDVHATASPPTRRS